MGKKNFQNIFLKRKKLHISMKLVYILYDGFSCLGMFGCVSVQTVAWL